MNTIVADFELVRPSNSDELWVIVPTLPLRDWPTVRRMLPAEVQAYELDCYVPVRHEGTTGFSDGWVLRAPAGA